MSRRKQRKKNKKKRFHYIYKIHFLCGFPAGRYYIGKRTYCGSSIDKDSYTGSGRFCKEYFSMYSPIAGETYIKEILEINPSVARNALREEIWIGDLWKSDPLCMNQMPGGLCYKEVCGIHTLFQGRSEKIRQYGLDGDLIKEWDSIQDAETTLNINNIGVCCRGIRRTAGNFMWRYSSDNIAKLDPQEALEKQARAVLQYSIEGEFIKRYDKIQNAADALNISKKGIQECCIGRQKSAYGYIWKYEDPTYVRKCNRDLKKCGALNVRQYTLEGELVSEYESINEAARRTGVNPVTISHCCKNKQVSSGGYIWKYTENHA